MTCMMTGIFPRCDDQEELLVKRISNDEYRKLVRSLNEKQRQFFYHVLYLVKTSNLVLVNPLLQIHCMKH